ncbi:hypothetical protein KAF25_002954 [Fusarium avenaceum]|uniref:Xylanolytic transcriptional activator regulatory domain-containing protein n=1 Tax=Fusarium avenaceum TaxID=40199 RepID=A0A9P7H5R6_9HYPO|nr:hypothetical protein KAF25_002954 [Fusarium avenaceum]
MLRISNLELLRPALSADVDVSNAKGKLRLADNVSTIWFLTFVTTQHEKEDRISHVELVEAYTRAQKVIDTLFPSSSLEELASMTRQQLVLRLQSYTIPQRTIDDISHDSLQVLEPQAEQNFTWDEVSETSSETSRVADDVNGQAFSRQSLNASYLGLSSVPTILRVIVHLRPTVQKRVPEGPQAWRSPSMHTGSPDETSVMQIDEISLIDAYFDQIHPIIPMIDEAEFRCRYFTADLTQDETGSWLALLNMVLAMGSMASDSIHLTSHNIFYKRALSYINISSFGSGHIHMVQALALYSGMLLHFFNRPNTATASAGDTGQPGQPSLSFRWYYKYSNPYLVVSFMLGYVGVLNLGASKSWVLEPSNGINNDPGCFGNFDSTNIVLDFATSLACSEQFCRIAARIQERLIQLPLINLDEVNEFDRDLLTWRDSWNKFITNRDQGSANTARAILGWRLITTRLTLYRPLLLVTAIRRKAWHELSTSERTNLRKCLEIALEGIDMMCNEWSTNQVICWNIAWNLFQATLVVILCMMSDRAEAEQRGCSEYIVRSISLFGQMEPLDPGCTRSRKLIQLLFDNARELEPEIMTCREGDWNHLREDQQKDVFLLYLPGYSLSSMMTNVPREEWQGIGDQHVQKVDVLGDYNILNRDVRPDNFMVVLDIDSYRDLMIDFANCRFRREDETDADWGSVK